MIPPDSFANATKAARGPGLDADRLERKEIAVDEELKGIDGKLIQEGQDFAWGVIP